jgi:hypothetical protein
MLLGATLAGPAQAQDTGFEGFSFEMRNTYVPTLVGTSPDLTRVIRIESGKSPYSEKQYLDIHDNSEQAQKTFYSDFTKAGDYFPESTLMSVDNDNLTISEQVASNNDPNQIHCDVKYANDLEVSKIRLINRTTGRLNSYMQNYSDIFFKDDLEKMLNLDIKDFSKCIKKTKRKNK